jgi:hypothetical protein
MKGYKIFEPDWKCKGFQFEVGKELETSEKLEICKSGFHFCTEGFNMWLVLAAKQEPDSCIRLDAKPPYEPCMNFAVAEWKQRMKGGRG